MFTGRVTAPAATKSGRVGFFKALPMKGMVMALEASVGDGSVAAVADEQPDDAWSVMQRFYEAEAAYVAAGGYGNASYDQVAAYLHPEVVLHQAPGLPFTGSGTWRGRDGMERFLALFSQVWESMEFLDQDHWGDGQTVVVRSRVRFRARATGRQVETLILQLITVRDGRMLECRPFYWDPAAIAEACGLASPTGEDTVRQAGQQGGPTR
ncbi:nuclear transport factor 2 family protein [Actinomadura sp. 6K520]|uniref:nuclear transport factor 2 family protein n=1 Tax=Actinomadura sp. 6K520 TaxID=2530364 RepID=UPI001FB7833F|nr:nuclear transport factor 2 family protein [Actinomadura sp. 6K520]